MTQIKHPWLLFIGLALGTFMVGVDLLAIGIAIEPMKQALSVDIATLQWFLSAYAIGNSSFLVAAGRLADLYGRKRIFLVGLSVFILSSLAIALSGSPIFIIFARLIQGASGGILPLGAIATFAAIYPHKERTKWISGIVGMGGLGMVLGPLVGGFLIHYFSWRMVFLINLPVGLLSLALVVIFLPKMCKTAKPGERVDWIGVVLFTSAMCLFTIGISEGHFWGWMTLKTWAFFITSAILLTVFIFAQEKEEWPLIEFDLFKVKNFLVSGISGFMIYFAFTAWILVFGIYLQRVLGMTPQGAGMAFLPFGLMLAIFSPMMSPWAAKYGSKKLIVWGCFLGALSFLGMGFLPFSTHHLEMSLFFGLFGLGFIFVNANTIPAAIEFMPTEKAGIASAIAMMMRWLGGALGAAIISAIFMTHSSKRLDTLVQKNPALSSQASSLHDVLVGSADVKTLQALPQAKTLLGHAYHHGLSISMFVIAALFLITCLLSMKLISQKNQ